MKSTVGIALFVAVLAGFVSCKKDDVNKPASNGITGVWKGNYTIDPSTVKKFYSLRFSANGDVEELNASGAVLGKGAWEMDNNNIISAFYFNKDGDMYSLIGAYYPQQNKILGNWGYDDSSTDGGMYELER